MKRFGDFLADRGLITRSELEAAAERQAANNVSLGELAVDRRLLTEDQLRAIARLQRREDSRLGEIAVERRWLSEEQLNQLLEAQRQRQVRLGDVLVAMGALDRSTMEKALEEFRSEERERRRTLERSIERAPNTELVRGLLDFTAKHFLRTTRQPAKLISLTAESQFEASKSGGNEYFVSQRIRGGVELTFGLLLGEDMVGFLASGMLEREVEEPDDLALDGVSELVNMIVGNCLSRLSPKLGSLRTEVPRVARVGGSRLELGTCTRATFLSRRGRFEAVVVYS